MLSRAPFPWYGGKQYIVDELVSLLPPHEVYVEVFGGAGSLLFGKSPAKLEVFNDIDSGVVNFFRVLRDRRRCRELRRLLDLTPYSREEWVRCRTTWAISQCATDDGDGDGDGGVEMARRWFTAVVGSFGKHLGQTGTGWSFSKTPGHDKAGSFRSATRLLETFVARLRSVQIEHGDFARVIALYDGPGVLLYCDPPYVAGTRQRADRYRHEMTDDDHRRLLTLLLGVRGMVVLSGYRSAIYDEALVGWRRVDIGITTSCAKRVRGERTECVWLSPSAVAHQPELWT